MGKIKGQTEYEKFRNGGVLTRRAAMLAHCYECNGLEGSNTDCKGKSCPLYAFMPYRSKQSGERPQKSPFHTTQERVGV